MSFHPDLSGQQFPTSVLFVHLRMLPEVAHELLEGVHSPGQRHDYVDDDAVCAHAVTLHLHQGPKRPEEDELSEVLWAVAFEHQLIDGPSGPLCASQT